MVEFKILIAIYLFFDCFLVPRSKKDVFKFSFLPRTICEWNSLPDDIVNITSVNSFKSKLVNSF